jgi:hypothetical protein
MNSKSDFNIKNNGYLPPSQYSDINAPQALITSQGNITTNSTYQANPPSYPNLNHPQVNQVVQNQTTFDQAVAINTLNSALKSNGQFVACPFCKHQSVTRTEQTCSTGNVLCCVFFGPIAWVLMQAIRSKDMNCYDSIHYCTRCGNKLANYKAC